MIAYLINFNLKQSVDSGIRLRAISFDSLFGLSEAHNFIYWASRVQVLSKVSRPCTSRGWRTKMTRAGLVFASNFVYLRLDHN